MLLLLLLTSQITTELFYSFQILKLVYVVACHYVVAVLLVKSSVVVAVVSVNE